MILAEAAGSELKGFGGSDVKRFRGSRACALANPYDPNSASAELSEAAGPGGRVSIKRAFNRGVPKSRSRDRDVRFRGPEKRYIIKGVAVSHGHGPYRPTVTTVTPLRQGGLPPPPLACALWPEAACHGQSRSGDRDRETLAWQGLAPALTPGVTVGRGPATVTSATSKSAHGYSLSSARSKMTPDASARRTGASRPMTTGA